MIKKELEIQKVEINKDLYTGMDCVIVKINGLEEKLVIAGIDGQVAGFRVEK